MENNTTPPDGSVETEAAQALMPPVAAESGNTDLSSNGNDSMPSAVESIESMQTFQSVALGVLAIAAFIWLLKFAEAVFVPVLLGLILSYSLRPFVDWLQRVLFIPRIAGAALLLLLLFGSVGAGLWNLRDDAASVAAELPKAARMIREFIGTPRGETSGLLSDIRSAARELDQASAALSIDPAADPKVPASAMANKTPANAESRAALDAMAAANAKKLYSATALQRAQAQSQTQPRASSPTMADHLQSFVSDRIGKLLGVATTVGVAGLLAFLLLCAGTEHRKNLLQMVGQSLSRKKVTLTILNEIHAQVQYYLAATAVTNIALGLSTWALFAYFGIERALLWGVVAGLFHLIPYIGTGLFLGLCFLIGLVSLDGFWPAFYLTAIWLLFQFAIGFGLNNYIQSRSSRINSAALFVGFLLFGWLWGGWGLVVAAPVLAAMKAVSDRVPSLKQISTLLS